MVLTRRAYRAISRWLPNEVIIEIIQFTAKADQAALCRVSKLFHGLCLPILNREVHLKSYRCAVAFCSTIVKTPIRADAVRSITVSGFDEGGQLRLFPAMRSLLNTSPQLMQRLEHLSVTIDELDPFLAQCTFPHLLTCELYLLPVNSPPHDDPVVSFLSRHPTLTRIRLRNHRTLQTSSPKVQLPNLQYYTGNAPLLLHINSNCLREATVRWFHVEEADVEKFIIALGSLSQASVPFRLSNYHFLHNPGLIDSISRHMPHIQSLQLHEVLLDRPVWDVSQRIYRKLLT
ncbi:hypothetical protein B0H19DRAFT_1139059 [Mycena capillaripes]|nr:hypothetical protein B0H19DRAFT_1139059 [Mycena capillaripes]